MRVLTFILPPTRVFQACSLKNRMTQHHSGRPYAGCEHTQAIRIRKIKGIISPGLKSDILRRNSRFESSATSGIIAYLVVRKPHTQLYIIIIYAFSHARLLYIKCAALSIQIYKKFQSFFRDFSQSLYM